VIRATAIKRAGEWSGTTADTVVLDFDGRHRRRIAMTGVNGLAFLLDLAETTALNDGDGLVLEDKQLVAVKAAVESLLEVTCVDRDHLVRVAWHLGNRHLATELLGDRLRIRQDHVIEDMLGKLDAQVVHVDAPFNPEGGAYGHGQTHSHDNDQGHDHEDGHPHRGGHSHG
jgi:urease accessory protein